MDDSQQASTEPEFRPKFSGFHDLMPFKVQDVLLVASLYDSFILEEDGRLSQRVFQDFVELNLTSPPRITRAPSAKRAFKALEERSFDLVVTMLNLPDKDTETFISELKEHHAGTPVVLLTWDRESLRRRERALTAAGLDRAFLWTGDSGIFLALIKSVEDRRNLAHDVAKGDVRLLVVVEDSIRWYSAFLPLLYQEIMTQTRALMDQGLNDLDKLFRMRARMKLILVSQYEEALQLAHDFPDNVLGYISDIRYPRDGQEDAEAGFNLLEAVRKIIPGCPFLLLSAEPENAVRAGRIGATFLDKNRPDLLIQVGEFLRDHLGFGPFIFRNPDGGVIDVATDLDELAEKLAWIPDPVLRFHSLGNHFSHWLTARGEFSLAAAIRPWQVEDFEDLKSLRKYLVDRIRLSREEVHRGVIADMVGFRFDPHLSFARIGSGSLGGKSRGIAFLGALLDRIGLEKEFPGVHIRVPRTIALGAHVFRWFIEENDLQPLASTEVPDEELTERFLRGRLPEDTVGKLKAMLQVVDRPLAVRSSSLLEDSPDQPFAGVFSTHMLANNHPDLEVRLEQLCRAVKLVYASTWRRGAIRYLRATGNEPGEERMGVAIQELVGRTRERWYYPWFSGVAQTHNFYPIRYLKPEDGAVTVALGLGKTVVDGYNALRFSPAYPQVIPQISSPEQVLESTQKEFWALDLSRPGDMVEVGQDFPLEALDLATAEKHGTLQDLVSVVSFSDNRIRDGLRGDGPRVITFAPVLKWKAFPLAAILKSLLDRIRRAMAGPAEIEFAVLEGDPERDIRPQFNLLQVRPLTAAETTGEVDLAGRDGPDVLVRTTRALGHGTLHTVRDLVYVGPARFDRLQTRRIALEVEAFNDRLAEADRPYLLLGPGRWGTTDPCLGVPVTWDQVSGAKVIVEADIPGFEVEPSQGSHFFHNVTSFRIFLLTVALRRKGERVEWDRLEALPAETEGEYLRHLRFDPPLEVALDGHSGVGLVRRPS